MLHALIGLALAGGLGLCSLVFPRLRKSVTAANVTVTTTTETVVVTLTGVSMPSGDGRVRLSGFVQMTLGTATTTVTVRVRRGTTTAGTLVGEGNPIAIPSAAGTDAAFTTDVEDTPGEVAGQSYVLTVEQAAATGNGTVLQAALEASYP